MHSSEFMWLKITVSSSLIHPTLTLIRSHCFSNTFQIHFIILNYYQTSTWVGLPVLLQYVSPVYSFSNAFPILTSNNFLIFQFIQPIYIRHPPPAPLHSCLYMLFTLLSTYQVSDPHTHNSVSNPSVQYYSN